MPTSNCVNTFHTRARHVAEEEPKYLNIFEKLEQLFDEELLYRNPELTKELVVSRLNTTEQELGEVMRKVHYRMGKMP